MLTYVIAIFLFDLDFDHQRDEAILQETFQVQETISGFNTSVRATSTSTLITGIADLMPSIYASDATAREQVTAGVSVSVQFRPSHLFKYKY